MVLREDPGLDADAIAACLAAEYGLRAASIRYLPLGFDLHAFVYEVIVNGGDAVFLKIRSGPVFEPGLLVPRALIERGVPNILAPLRTRAGGLWCPLAGYAGYTAVLYPFVRGENAKRSGLTATQWRDFGVALRAVHDSGVADVVSDRLRAEDFALPSAALVRRMQALVAAGTALESPAARRFAAFWREQRARIDAMLMRAEVLGRSLQARTFARVLCHGDIHAANVLVGEDGRIWLIDWDGPLIAPRERDLMFVAGCRVARLVTPEEEERFFAGYGPTEIDRDALIYYRYERIVEDLGEVGKSVFLDPEVGEAVRADEAELAIAMFDSGGSLDHTEQVARTRWPSPA